MEFMQWNGQQCTSSDAEGGEAATTIIAWVNENGGEARHVPAITCSWDPALCVKHNRPVRIAIRTRDGWVRCAPGQRVVMGDVLCRDRNGNISKRSTDLFREFTVEG